MKPLRLLAVSCAVSAALLSGAAMAQSDWEPARNIELVVPYSPGGGSDLNARALAEVLRENELVDRNIVILNRPGGSGAVGNAYTASRPADGHTFMTINSGQVMSMLANDAAIQLDSLTALATLALDPLVLAVAADGDFADFAAFQGAATENPQSVTIGGAARGSEDHLVFTLLNDSAGGGFQYVPFDGSGDSLSALLGGHISAIVANPIEVKAQVEAGKVRIIGTFTEERLGGAFAEAPTLKELGHPEAVMVQFRGYAGPPDMDEEAVKYWGEALRKASETEQWKADAERNLVQATYMGPEESQAFWSKEAERYQQILDKIGTLN
ncbi:Bug family tripartite tricarboxylate transporter substrate binding protein [Marinivivus vitaminiproducens]|uniref:Bug family tripartite tricarboxylate transporter substrate binding protein n=1 Tax=Marinivivus vitaminiproducens TaxID=3035935 RepID=UPI00279B5734|nr:tripartite tricarboxylate transporter substrate binding protein [Geminicoccaceae bacterium SCSIO 64248]